ncbi:MAG: D-glycero-alpha-D-manno-heptose-1,7-bisphosphate 7-phosphatase, partial [Planctomycetota bacterium]
MSNKAIFLDRDDTLIEDPGYINNPDQVELIAGVTDALIELRKMGYKLVVVSNQSGVARGIITEKAIAEIHSRLEELLIKNGAVIDKIYYCPYHPDGVVPKYRKKSNLRKPSPGMILKACDEMNIDANQSWMIGNNDSDIEAGLKAGCKTVLIDNPSKEKTFGIENIKSDYRAVNMKEAVNIIKKQSGLIKDTAKQDGRNQIRQAKATPEREAFSMPDSQKTKMELNSIHSRTTEQLLERIL